jgi:hypothetical protein
MGSGGALLLLLAFHSLRISFFLFLFCREAESRSKLTSPVLLPPSPIINCRRRPLLPLADHHPPPERDAARHTLPRRVADRATRVRRRDQTRELPRPLSGSALQFHRGHARRGLVSRNIIIVISGRFDSGRRPPPPETICASPNRRTTTASPKQSRVCTSVLLYL